MENKDTEYIDGSGDDFIEFINELYYLIFVILK